MYGDYLSHYGVLGMHWGKRKGSTSTGKTSKPKKSSGDPEWDHVQDLYKKTGKNGISRVVNNAKGKGKEVAAYKKAYNKYTDKADKEYDKKMAAAEAIKKAPEHRTNGQIVANGVIKHVGIQVATNVVGNALYSTGHTYAAAFVVGVGGGATIVNIVGTAGEVRRNH